MSTNFASLGIAVESSQAAKAADDLDKLVDSAEGAQKAIDDLGKSGEGMASTGKKITQAENEVAQGVDKSTAAIDRKSGASRKATESAAAEITVISQLDKAMTGNIDSIESLVRAEGLLERARKGGLVTIEDQAKYQDQLGKAYDKIEKAEAKELAQKQKLIDAENRQIEALKRTVNGIDPVTVKLAKLEAQEKALNDLHKTGQIDAERYQEALSKIGKDRSGLTATETAFDKLKLGTRQAQENVMQLANALQSGDLGSGARAIAQLGAGAGESAKSLAGMVIPAGLLVAVLGSIGYAYFDAMKQAREFNAAINGGSNDAGQSIASLKAMSESAGVLTGNLAGAREAVIALASGAATSGTQMQNLAQAAAAIGEVTGKGAGEIAASLANVGDTATESASKISEKYGLLTYEQYEVIKGIDDQGDHQRALDVLSENLNLSAQERLKAYRSSLSDIERDWDDIGLATKRAYAYIRAEAFPDLSKQIEIVQRVLDTRKGGGFAGAISNGLSSLNSALGLGTGEDDDSTEALEKKLAGLKARQAASESLTATTGETTHANKELIAVQKELDKQMDSLDPLTKRKEAYKKLNEQFTKLYQDAEKTGQKSATLNGVDFDGKKFSGGAYDKLRKKIDEDNKDPKAGAGSVDLTSFNDAKNNLTDIVTDYRNAQKELEAQQKAGVVSLSDYAKQRSALINQEKDDVTAAYQSEIDALEAAKTKKGTTAAQSIQLDQKIADARQGMVKAQKDADSQLTVIATNEKGRLEQLTAASEAYVNQLERQRAALEAAGSRAANGLGLGDRQAALQASLDATTDKFNDERAKLLDRRKTAPDKYSQEDYLRDLASLEDAERKYRDTVVDNYDKMSEAQGDWRSGASSAFQNYLQSANDVAGQTKSLFTNAFSSMEDAVANFAVTGKLSFSDFTKSILADMARIATRQAASSIFSSIAAAWGGGGTSFGSSIGSALVEGRASGGPVDPNTLYEVNEKGPELFSQGGRSYLMTGAEGGSVTPLMTGGGSIMAAAGSGGGGGGGNTYNFPVSVSVQTAGAGGTATQEDTTQLGKGIQQAAKTEAETAIAKGLQPGGSIWRLVNGR
ncbi:phage tail tape measure protein [Pseudomonas tolaasii]|uniref:phage tail tape measure protein n=1 Tax=Pseudomonas tolaasii TaxID=29442 RepID=UPI0015A18FB5|nr:phage tail tape measure protein [Pseudomonas tolaasii]NWC30616.1 phage tail tape measure protein [Pseudomonas tolaasii]NWC51042.1 phage tail tape measure protein [Pseudomonas tolaasii]NWE62638.1 phage tail tape measure protein [Pseudomonas tolaasii]